MSDEQLTPGERRRKQAEDFTRKVCVKEQRRIKGKNMQDQTVWFGLGMFVILRWSLAVPIRVRTSTHRPPIPPLPTPTHPVWSRLFSPL